MISEGLLVYYVVCGFCNGSVFFNTVFYELLGFSVSIGLMVLTYA